MNAKTLEIHKLFKMNFKRLTNELSLRDCSYGDRTIAAAGPRLWNSLPVQLRNPDITYRLGDS